jgi:uncharacterized protein
LATGLLGGVLVMLFGQPRRENGSGPDEPRPPECHESCCEDRGSRNVVWRAMEYGFVALPRDIGLSLLVGVVIAGAITALTPPDWWQQHVGGGILSIVVMMAVGIPIYVCASASVPIAAGLIHLGASPGAALAFLVAGPATNAATISTIWKLMGGRTVALYLSTIVTSAVGGGLLLDWLMSAMHGVVPPLAAEHVHEAGASGWLSAFWAILLLAVVVFSYLRRPAAEPYPGAAALGEADLSPPPESLQLVVTGMTCEHCAAAVRRALAECPGVATVEVDLAAGRAVVGGAGLDVQCLVAAVGAAGYQAAKRD